MDVCEYAGSLDLHLLRRSTVAVVAYGLVRLVDHIPVLLEYEAQRASVMGLFVKLPLRPTSLLLDALFHEQIVRRRHLVMFILTERFDDSDRVPVAKDLHHCVDDLEVDNVGIVRLDNRWNGVWTSFDIPWVLHNLADVEPLLGIDNKNFPNQVCRVRRDEVRNRENTRDDLFVELLKIIIVKRQITAEHGEKNYAESPDVHHWAVVLTLREHLGRCVRRRAARGFKPVVLRQDIGQSEVDDLYVQSLVEENVF